MSSIRLYKDHNGKKAGVVISVSFSIGKMLIAQGVGMYPGSRPRAGLVELPVRGNQRAIVSGCS